MRKLEYKYWVVIIYVCVLFLDRLDLTIVNITLPTLAHVFNVPITNTGLINTSFLLGLAVATPISNWLGDSFGAKRVFITATLLFGIGSLLCAFTPFLSLLVVFRCLQGIGGGIIIPVGMTMVYRNCNDAEYASIISYVIMPSLLAPAIAPALGGLIISLFGWRWVFIFVAPICVVAAILSAFILHKDEITAKNDFDVSGFVLAATSISLLFYAISAIGGIGFTAQSKIALGVAVLLLIVFILYEKDKPHPLVNMRFFQHKLFAQANLIQLAFQIGNYGSIFVISMYLQAAVGMSALTAGLVMGAQALGAIATNRLSVKLFDNFGAGRSIAIGLLGLSFLTIGTLLIRSPTQAIAAGVLFFVRGTFVGLCGAPIQAISVLGFEKKELGSVNTLFNTTRQLSISLGIALSSLLISFGARIFHPEKLLSHKDIDHNIFYFAFCFITVITLVGMLMACAVDNKKILKKIKKA